jgi:hypothetical protein
MRGSVRLRAYSTDSKNSLTVGYRAVEFSPLVNFKTTTASIATTRENCVAVAPGPLSVYPCPEISVPYYNNYPMSNVVFDGNVANTTAYMGSRPQSYVGVYTLGLTGSIFVQRQAGDDFSFGFWTGTPSLINASYSGNRQSW